MKRFLNCDHNHSDEKLPKHSSSDRVETVDVFPLLDLPEDEFKLVLRQLRHDDKLNMKLVSKASEKRIMTLDPDMRNWSLFFHKNSFEELKVLLSRSKLKHIKDEDLQDININLIIRYDNEKTAFPFVFMILAETLINEWKSNIVDLKITLSGQESYLLNPDLKMNRLQTLEFGGGKCYVRAEKSYGVESDSDSSSEDDSDDESDSDEEVVAARSIEASKIASFLVQQHEDTLKNLTFTDLDISIPSGLQLKGFNVEKVSEGMALSTIKDSHSTLEIIELENIRSAQDSLKNSGKENDALLELDQLKELYVKDVVPELFVIIINSSSNTLETIVLESTGGQSKEEYLEEFAFCSSLLKLKSLKLRSISSINLLALLKASHKSLEELEVVYEYRQELLFASANSFGLNGIEMRLKKLDVILMPARMIATLICSSQYSLKELMIEAPHPCIGGNYFHLNCVQLHLTKFIAVAVSKKIVASIVSLSHRSLEVLHIRGLSREDSYEEPFHLQCPSLKLKEFLFNTIPSQMISTIIDASQATLKELMIFNPIHGKSFQLGALELQLKRLEIHNASSTYFLAPILRASSATLETLVMHHVDTEHYYVIHDFYIEFNLKEFVATNVSTRLVASILKASQATVKYVNCGDLFQEPQDHFQLVKSVLLRQLKNLIIGNTSIYFVASVIESSQASLKYLDLSNIDLLSYRLSFHQLQLVGFSSRSCDAYIAATFLHSSISTLRNLDLTEISELGKEISNIKEIKVILGNISEDGLDSDCLSTTRAKHIKHLKLTSGHYSTYFKSTTQLFAGIKQLLMKPAEVQECKIYGKAYGELRDIKRFFIR